MTNVYIESSLKTLLDADTWTVSPDGVTKATYIWAESHSIALNLDNPGIWNSTANNVILVIHPSSRSILNRTAGSESFNWIGDLKIFANSVANIKSAFDLLKIIADADPNLLFQMPGINGNPKTNKYWAVITYSWSKHVSH